MDKELSQEFRKIDQRFEKMDQRFETLISFLHKHMATKDELAELRADLPTKADFSQLQRSVDGLAKNTNDYYQEMKVLQVQVRGMEEWIAAAAVKIGVEYRQ